MQVKDWKSAAQADQQQTKVEPEGLGSPVELRER